jgi:PKD repeat protein
MICDGAGITFDDASWGGPVTAWEWTLSGPTILQSTVQNPLFLIPTPGSYNVTLIASNSAGSDTITRNNYVLVSDDAAGAQAVPFSEGFETPNVFSTGYIAEDGYGNGSIFTQTLSVGHTGSGSVMLNAFTNPLEGDKDELITPPFDLTNTSAWQLSFVYACATTSTDSSDNTQMFKVYSSVDCGRTWNQRMTLTGMQVPTVTSLSNFVPASAADWDTVNIILPFNLSQPNVRFKFEFNAPVDSVSNNLFIDDINIASGVGITEAENASSFTIYPNPGDGSSTIAYSLTEPADVQYSIYDVTGRLITRVDHGQQAAGSYAVEMQQVLPPGTYLVAMKIGEQVSTQKYIVTQ